MGICLTIFTENEGVSLPLPSITLTSLDHVCKSELGLSLDAMCTLFSRACFPLSSTIVYAPERESIERFGMFDSHAGMAQERRSFIISGDISAEEANSRLAIQAAPDEAVSGGVRGLTSYLSLIHI